MADSVTIKRGYSALYLIELANRVIEALREAGTATTTVDTVSQNELAETVVNTGADITY